MSAALPLPPTATTVLCREDAYRTECPARVIAGADDGVILDQTVFYPMGGGQPGDSGQLVGADGRRLVVTDTRYGAAGEILHVLAAGTPPPAVGDAVTACLDWPRRHRLMRMHTCLHLLSCLVEGKITGAGVGDGKGRIDFDLPDAAPDKDSLTERLNALIASDAPTTVCWITDAELDGQPDLVRTLSVMPPRGSGRVRLIDIAGLDRQPCGGTHVARLGEIGRVRIAKIEKKGRLNRRISVVLDDD